jgi:putative ABC transport system ATP-binding protein
LANILSSIVQPVRITQETKNVTSTPLSVAPGSVRSPAPKTRGTVIDWGWLYDAVVWFFTRGDEAALRHLIAGLARLRPGEAVLDVGCGTGSLALIAKQRVGDCGRVCGVDPGPRQIARARSKVARLGLAVEFEFGVIEQLAFPDQAFDVVLSTFMIDHLPDDLRRRGIQEAARVLRPGGRLLVLVSGRLGDVPALITEAGFAEVQTGERSFPGRPGMTRLAFALASKASDHVPDRRSHTATTPVSNSTTHGRSSGGRAVGERPSAADHLIELRQVAKTYQTGSGAFTALRDVSLRLGAGEFVAVVGKSGSGKTTLLNLLAGIDRPTSGDLLVGSARLGGLSESQLADWRGATIGLVFQFFQLLPTLTVAENVMLPMDFAGRVPAAERRGRALQLLDRVGIRDQADKLPAALSGGQQQRAAIARALANDPPILLADEPTGNLDSATSDSVLELFADLNAEGRTIVMVTHERDVERYATREVTLVDGRVAGDAVPADRSQRPTAAEALP